MITLKLYKCLCNDNVLYKTNYLNDALTIEGELQTSQNIETPTFIIEATLEEVNLYNYAEINGRYYFINDKILVANNLVQLNLKQDVLMTYSDFIVKDCDCFIKRCNFKRKDKDTTSGYNVIPIYNPLLVDNKRPLTNACKLFENGTNRLDFNVSDTSYIIIMSKYSDSTDLSTTEQDNYQIDIPRELVKFLVNDNYYKKNLLDTKIFGSDAYWCVACNYKTRKYIKNYFLEHDVYQNSLLSIRSYPFRIDEFVQYRWDNDPGHHIIGSGISLQITKDASIPFTNEYTAYFAKPFFYKNNPIILEITNPYPKSPWMLLNKGSIDAWFPYISWVSIDPKLVIESDTKGEDDTSSRKLEYTSFHIYFQYFINVLDGTCTLYVLNDNRDQIINYQTGNIANDISLDSSNYQSMDEKRITKGVTYAISFLGSLGTFGLGVATANPLLVAGGGTGIAKSTADYANFVTTVHYQQGTKITDPNSLFVSNQSIRLYSTLPQPTFNDGFYYTNEYVTKRGLPCNETFVIDKYTSDAKTLIVGHENSYFEGVIMDYSINSNSMIVPTKHEVDEINNKLVDGCYLY